MDAKESPVRRPWARFWTGVVGCVVPLFLAAVLFPVFARAHMGGGPNPYMSRVKQVGLALLMYSDDNDRHLPPNLSNPATLRKMCSPYLRSDSVLTAADPLGGSVLANGVLSGIALSAVSHPSSTVLSFYSRPWQGHGVTCYADGHGRILPSFEDMLKQLTVDPFAARSAAQKEETGG